MTFRDACQLMRTVIISTPLVVAGFAVQVIAVGFAAIAVKVVSRVCVLAGRAVFHAVYLFHVGSGVLSWCQVDW